MMQDFEIVDASDEKVTRYELVVNDTRYAALVADKQGHVTINWMIYGPQTWPDAQAMVRGVLQLSVIADQLSGGKLGQEET